MSSKLSYPYALITALGAKLGLGGTRLAALGTRVTTKVVEIYTKNAARSLPARSKIFKSSGTQGSFLREASKSVAAQFGIEATFAGFEEFYLTVVAKQVAEGTEFNDAFMDLILSSDPKDDVLIGMATAVGKQAQDVSGYDKVSYLAAIAGVLLSRKRAAGASNRYKSFKNDNVDLGPGLSIRNVNNPNKTVVVTGRVKHTIKSIAYDPLNYLYAAAAVNGIVSGVTGEETNLDKLLTKFDGVTDVSRLVGDEDIDRDSENVIVNQVQATAKVARGISQVARSTTEMIKSKAGVSDAIDSSLINRMDSADLRLAKVRDRQDSDGFTGIKR
jgi:hypothetical protein